MYYHLAVAISTWCLRALDGRCNNAQLRMSSRRYTWRRSCVGLFTANGFLMLLRQSRYKSQLAIDENLRMLVANTVSGSLIYCPNKRQKSCIIPSSFQTLLLCCASAIPLMLLSVECEPFRCRSIAKLKSASFGFSRCRWNSVIVSVAIATTIA